MLSSSSSRLGTSRIACKPVAVRPSLLRHGPARPRLQRPRCLGVKASAAAALSYSPDADASRTFPALAPLPTPPQKTTLTSVLPYLAKLAFSEKQMKWRLGVAFICMIISKAAGKLIPCAYTQFPHTMHAVAVDMTTCMHACINQLGGCLAMFCMFAETASESHSLGWH